jgi:hypothetical protein
MPIKLPSPRPRPMTDHEWAVHELRTAAAAERSRLQAEYEARRFNLPPSPEGAGDQKPD